jgi:hypothetical protein
MKILAYETKVDSRAVDIFLLPKKEKRAETDTQLL